MFGTEASFLPDGSCRLSGDIGGFDAVWPSVEIWATDWLDERRSRDLDAASTLLHAACTDAVPGVVDALIALTEAAQGDAELLNFIGAGPLEDLLSHTGNGSAVLIEVERAARQNGSFRRALANVWLGDDVPLTVRERLVPLGARNLHAEQ